jgi:CHAT domain-containing protein/tetratricopeptide (TPR) repeat protein
MIREWNKVGRIADAERGARVLLRDTESEHGPNALEVADVLDQLAIALRRGGKARDPETMEVCERALRIKTKTVGEQDSSYAISLRNIGMLYYARGIPKAALPILERALGIQEHVFSESHADVAITLSMIAAARSALGDDSKAAEAMERTVEIQRIVLASDDPDRAMALTGLAAIRYSMGDFAEAAWLGEEALWILKKKSAPDSPMLGNCYHNLGSIYSELGDFDAAQVAFRRALRIRGSSSSPNPILAAETNMNLAFALQCLGQFRGARSRYLAALSTYEGNEMGQSAEAGMVRARLGLCYLDMQDFVSAKAQLQDALRILETTLGAERWELWMPLRGLARVAAHEGDSLGARRLYERNLSIIERALGDSHPDLATVLAEYGLFLLAAGDSGAAFDASLRAARINVAHMRRTASEIPERQGLAYGVFRPNGLDAALAILGGTPYGRNNTRAATVWDAVIRQRTLVLDEIMTRSRAASADSTLRETLADLERARRRLANLSVRGPVDEADRYRERLSQARDDVERLERTVASRSDAVRTEQSWAGIGFDDVSRALPSSSALVGFVAYGAKSNRVYLAFVGKSAAEVAAVPLGGAREIDSLVLAWRRTASKVSPRGTKAQSREEATCRRVGESLRRMIWDPLVPYFEGSSTVFLVPEGSLQLVSWAALPGPAGGYLVESGPLVHLVSSERDLTAGVVKGSRGVGLLACGDPEFNATTTPAGRHGGGAPPNTREASPGTHRGGPKDCIDFRTVLFAPLPGAAKEVGEIAAEWPDSTSLLVLEGALATERAVKENAPGRLVVHLATHGFFLERACLEQPSNAGSTRGIGAFVPATKRPGDPRPGTAPLQLSGLALAGANRRQTATLDDEDGILTAEEISSLNLNGVDWAVLSACDTGLGVIQPGEGVLGFRRSFQAAGARTVIMSLWSVDDESTRQWMKRLYQEKFRRGIATAEAVRAASLGLLHDRRAQGQSTHPFYWAGFVATGDWN